MNLQKMFDIIRKTNSLINTHVGSNGDAHLPASEDQNGFMSTVDKFQINRNGMYARGQSGDVAKDIMALDYGFYAGKNWLNAPVQVDDTTALIEIKGNSGFKAIKYYWVAGGKTYNRYVYGSLDTGWENTDWIDVAPINGFTGSIKSRRIKTNTTNLIEVRIDVNCSLTSHGVVQLAALPANYQNATGLSLYQTMPAQIANDNITVNVAINSGNKINVFRNDSRTEAITKIFGTFFFTE